MAEYEAKYFYGDIDKVTAEKLIKRIAAEKSFDSRSLKFDNISLYGAGELGRLGLEYLQKHGKKTDYVVDINAKVLRGENNYWSDKNLKTPEEIPYSIKKQTTLAVSVVKSSFCDLRNDLIQEGWGEVIPFYDLTEVIKGSHPMRNGWFANDLLVKKIAEAIYVSGNLADSHSLAHNLSCLAWRTLREEWSFEKYPIEPDNRFLIPEVLNTITAQTSFLDIGAHTGLVTQRLLEHSKVQIKEVCAIEPDPVNNKYLEHNLQVLSDKYKVPISIMKMGLSHSSGEKNFLSGLGYASQFSNSGLPIVCSALDDLDLSPTIIKIHVEGAELEVLKGALITVKINRPIVMLTTYHNVQGLIDLPFWAAKNMKNYNFYLRQHSWCATGVVLYCIPMN
jgi:FkbM family methyltransferase